MDSNRQLRHVPLLAGGVVAFLGLILLGGLTGLLWHIRTFDWWVKLSPSVLEPTADWFVWALGFLIVLSPSFVALVRRMARADRVVFLTSVIFPLLSLVIVTISHTASATALVGSSFLATYVLISRSQLLLRVDSGLALRAVLTVVFGLLSPRALCLADHASSSARTHSSASRVHMGLNNVRECIENQGPRGRHRISSQERRTEFRRNCR